MIIRGGTAAGGGAGGGASAEPENLPCPRCESTNTKFCYYNNYNLSQPRYFCKACRRYWTRGGTLRNIPFGGGHRKKRPLSSSPSPARPRRPPPSPPPPATLSHSPGGASFSTLLGLGGERMMSGSGGGFLGLDYGHGLGVLGLDENMGLGLGFGKVEWPPLVVDPIPTAEDDGDAGVCSGDLPDSGGDCFPWPEQDEVMKKKTRER